MVSPPFQQTWSSNNLVFPFPHPVQQVTMVPWKTQGRRFNSSNTHLPFFLVWHSCKFSPEMRLNEETRIVRIHMMFVVLMVCSIVDCGHVHLYMLFVSLSILTSKCWTCIFLFAPLMLWNDIVLAFSLNVSKF